MPQLEKQARSETMLSIFLSMAANSVPVRMDRSAAKRYVNRKSDKLFDEFCAAHGVKESIYSDAGKREYYTIDLASATLQDYEKLEKGNS